MQASRSPAGEVRGAQIAAHAEVRGHLLLRAIESPRLEVQTLSHDLVVQRVLHQGTWATGV